MYQRAAELKHLRQITLGDFFPDIDDFGLEFKLDEDYVKESNP